MRKPVLWFIALSHVLAVSLWLLLWLLSRHMCTSDCGDVGLVLAPLVVPVFLATCALVVMDITLMARGVSPPRFKHWVSWLTPLVLVLAPVSWLAVTGYVGYRQDHYSIERAVTVVKACEARSLGGYGPHPYLFLKSDPYTSITVSGGDAARVALNKAAVESASRCDYDLGDFYLPPS
jgi:hypothetical protein